MQEPLLFYQAATLSTALLHFSAFSHNASFCVTPILNHWVQLLQGRTQGQGQGVLSWSGFPL